MSNRKGYYKSVSERIELKDVLAKRRFIKPLSKSEMRELENYLSRKTLIVMDVELDTYKEDK